ncbi:hypothetical protein [Prauserella muralis]|uniref:hypothetical protein n=1 Tax=Prauserella muralis TaxID=588067 RepID=UPI0011AC5117|nr:hypothetical protein [Prauserella muralis]TWE29205.1 YD repeat-containing protein [Prauserella muralis]
MSPAARDQLAPRTSGHGRFSTTSRYDNTGRPVGATDRDGDTVLRSAEITYDALDNPCAPSAATPTAPSTPDPEPRHPHRPRRAGLVTAAIDPRGTDPVAFTTSYTDDALGRATTVAVPRSRSGQAGGTRIATDDPLGEQPSTSDQTFTTPLGRQPAC